MDLSLDQKEFHQVLVVSHQDQFESLLRVVAVGCHLGLQIEIRFQTLLMLVVEEGPHQGQLEFLLGVVEVGSHQGQLEFLLGVVAVGSHQGLLESLLGVVEVGSHQGLLEILLGVLHSEPPMVLLMPQIQ